MRRLFLIVVAAAAVAALTVGVVDRLGASPGPAEALPAPDAAIPSDPARLAAALTTTTRSLRDALGRWSAAGAVPDDVTLLALHQQRMIRAMTSHRGLGDATLAQLPVDVRGEARDTVLARRQLAAIQGSRGRVPRVKIGPAAPAQELERFYVGAQRRFAVDWSVLAAVNFVESAFGRVRNASSAGARGPMQFLQSTWRRYGLGGDINDPHDAILGAANYLRRSGAPRNYDRALFAFNHSRHYVRAVRLFASRMGRDRRAFLTYYAWQVYARTPGGVRRLTGPGVRAAARSGVHGRVVGGPVCPVERVPPDPKCAPRGFAAAVRVFSPSDHRTVARSHTDGKGRFRIGLRPGRYGISARPAAGGALPRCPESVRTTVRRGRYTQVSIDCDTGIR